MVEVIDVVDKNDRVIGTATRKEVLEKNLLHRGVVIFVMKSNGEIFVHKRSEAKDRYPGFYDIFFGGAVKSGESYDEAAKRELKEETGIDKRKLNFLLKFRYKSDKDNQFIGVYSCIFDGKLIVDEREIQKWCFVTKNKLKQLLKEKNFCLYTLELLKKHRKMLF